MLQKIQSSLSDKANFLIIGLLSLSLSLHSHATPDHRNEDNSAAHKLAEITTQWGQLTQSQSLN